MSRLFVFNVGIILKKIQRRGHVFVRNVFGNNRSFLTVIGNGVEVGHLRYLKTKGFSLLDLFSLCGLFLILGSLVGIEILGRIFEYGGNVDSAAFFLFFHIYRFKNGFIIIVGLGIDKAHSTVFFAVALFLFLKLNGSALCLGDSLLLDPALCLTHFLFLSLNARFFFKSESLFLSLFLFFKLLLLFSLL